MPVTASGWKNKKGTTDRSCKCGSWKQHWINASGLLWPTVCSVSGCYNAPTLGAHIINKDVSGEYIVPTCAACNGKDSEFNLKGGVTLISANKQKTCEQ